jgi:hypothetical protein
MSPVGGSDESWGEEFTVSGFDGEIHCSTIYNGEIIIGGSFTRFNDIPLTGIARWDGQSWRPIGNGLSNGKINALVVFDNKLFAGGRYEVPGHQSWTRNVASWDGSSWSYLPFIGADVFDMAVFHDSLFVAGALAENIRAWADGSWQSVGGGLDRWAFALTVFNDKLVAGGYFRHAGDVEASSVAQWDGSNWAPLGSGVYALNNQTVRALLSYQGTLIVSGVFREAGGLDVRNVAGWDGSSWSSMGGLGNWSLYSNSDLAVYENSVYAAGGFSEGDGGIARWNGSSWEGLGVGHPFWNPPRIQTLLVHDGKLIAGGGVVASWDGTEWKTIGESGDGGGLDRTVRTMAFWNGDLIAGGDFKQAGKYRASYRARWDRARWHPLGDGVDGPVYALTSFSDGLVVGGRFTRAGEDSALSVARWDGEKWYPLGDGIGRGSVSALAVYQGNLIVGGTFEEAGGAPAAKIAQWDGSEWSPLAPGIPSSGQHWCVQRVRALLVHNGDLFVAGQFLNAGSLEVGTHHIARWDGLEWHTVGGGILDDCVRDVSSFCGSPPGISTASPVYMDVVVNALTGLSDILFVGGSFLRAGMVTDSPRLMAWNGQEWVGVSDGIIDECTVVRALEQYRGDLIVAGDFPRAGISGPENLARLSAGDWVSLGSGIGGVVYSLATDGHDLYVGGNFTQAGNKDSYYIARWSEGPVPVALSYVTAEWRNETGILRWAVAEATDHAGFHVYRQATGADRERLTGQILRGQSEYEFIDESPPKEGADYWLAEISRTGETTWHGPAVLLPASLPARVALSPPAPNPFTSETRITYSLPERQHVSLAVYDLQGRRVATLVDKDQGAGEYTLSWDGHTATSGLYFVRLQAGDTMKTQKLMFLR